MWLLDVFDHWQLRTPRRTDRSRPMPAATIDPANHSAPLLDWIAGRLRALGDAEVADDQRELSVRRGCTVTVWALKFWK